MASSRRVYLGGGGLAVVGAFVSSSTPRLDDAGEVKGSVSALFLPAARPRARVFFCFGFFSPASPGLRCVIHASPAETITCGFVPRERETELGVSFEQRSSSCQVDSDDTAPALGRLQSGPFVSFFFSLASLFRWCTVSCRSCWRK